MVAENLRTREYQMKLNDVFVMENTSLLPKFVGMYLLWSQIYGQAVKYSIVPNISHLYDLNESCSCFINGACHSYAKIELQTETVENEFWLSHIWWFSNIVECINALAKGNIGDKITVFEFMGGHRLLWQVTTVDDAFVDIIMCSF